MRTVPYAFLTLLGLLAAPADAAMVAKPVAYTLGGTEFEGHLVYDDSSKVARPGLLMVPNWYGAGPQAVAKAKTIAGRDYVIFVVDMYGKDVRPKDATEALAAVKPLYGNRQRMRELIQSAHSLFLERTSTLPLDPKRLAAIGFCFGGSVVLELARNGANVAAVVSFHGNLSSDDPALAKQIKGKVLALNGADDKNVPPEQIEAFASEMRAAGVDWQFVNFGGAVHCFTETGEKEGNCKYDEKTARRAYAMMRDFLDEAFAGE